MTEGPRAGSGRPGVPGGLIMGALRNLRYPIDREELGAEARRRGAPGVMLDLLARMPDRPYVSAEDVAREARRAWERW